MDNTSLEFYQRLQIIVYFLGRTDWPEKELGISREKAIVLIANILGLDPTDPKFIDTAFTTLNLKIVEQRPIANIPVDLKNLVEDYEKYLQHVQEQGLNEIFPNLDEQTRELYLQYRNAVLTELEKTEAFKNNPKMAELVSDQLSQKLASELPQVAESAFEQTVPISSYELMITRAAPEELQEAITPITRATWPQAKKLAVLQRRLPPPPKLPLTPIQTVNRGEFSLVSYLKKIVLSPIVKPLQIAIKILPIKIPPVIKKAIIEGLTHNDLQLTINNLIRTGLSLNHPQVVDLEKQKNVLEQFESGHPFLANILRNYHEFSKKLRFGLTTFPAEKYLTKIQPPIRQKLIQPVAQWFKDNTAGKFRSLISNLGIFARKLINKPEFSIFGGLGTMVLSVIAPIPQPAKIVFFSFGSVPALSGLTRKFPQFISKTASLLGKSISGAANLANSFISSLTVASAPGSLPVIAVVGAIAGVAILSLIVITTAGSTFVPSEMGGSVPHVGTPVDPRCSEPSLHLAKDVICTLNRCGITQVIPETWTTTEECLEAGSLPNKQLIIDEFNYSTNTVGNNPNEPKYYGLQCVGFAKGIMAALGKPIIKDNINGAKDYLEPPPPTGYQPINTKMEEVQTGDLVIMRGTIYGHIGIVIDKTDNSILVTQAFGDNNGLLQVTEINPIYFDGFLRPI